MWSFLDDDELWFTTLFPITWGAGMWLHARGIRWDDGIFAGLVSLTESAATMGFASAALMLAIFTSKEVAMTLFNVSKATKEAVPGRFA